MNTVIQRKTEGFTGEAVVNKFRDVLVEKETQGPIKKVCFVSNQIAAVAMQEEQYV